MSILSIFLSVRCYHRGFLYYVSVYCNWNDWCPAGLSNNNMHIRTALCLMLFTACFMLCELPDTSAQRVIYHWGCILHLSVCYSFFQAYHNQTFLLELSLVTIPTLTSRLHKFYKKKMNFKLKIWLLSFCNVGVGQKRALFESVFIWNGKCYGICCRC